MMLDTFMSTRLQSIAFVRTAEVVEQGDDNRICVSLDTSGNDDVAGSMVWAVLALEIEGQLLPGDKVLITGESLQACYRFVINRTT